jgi:hypothetical protein
MLTTHRSRPTVVVAALLTALTVGCGSTVQAGSTPTGDGLAATTGSGLSAPSVAPDGTSPVVGSAVAPGTSGAQATGSGAGGALAREATTSTTQQAAGPTARTGPILIGFLYNDFTAAARAAGLSTTDFPDPLADFKALVAAVNKRGGLAGRQIRPLYYRIDGLTSDYSTSAQAACADFTEDHHVEAVVSVNFTWDNLSTCLTKAGVPQLDGAPWTMHTNSELTQYPGLFWAGSMATDRYARAVIEQSISAGHLSSKNKLGVVADGCPSSAWTYDHVVGPLLKARGIAVDHIVAFKCVNGAGDVDEIEAGIHSAILKMRTDGVDRVTYLTMVEGVANTQLAMGADNQHWYPGYLLSSVGILQLQASQIPQSQLVNTRGVGWVPVLDVSKPPQTPMTRECLALNRAGGGETPTNVGMLGYLYLACDPLLLLRAALVATHGVGGISSVRPALEAMGSGYASVGSLGGQTSFATGRHDGAADAAPFSYKSGCSCFSYDRRPQRVP